MAVQVGNGFYLTTALNVAGTGAEGTVLTARDIDKVVNIQTDGTLVPNNGSINTGDSFVVDIDNDGDFSDEVSTTQTDNDRYANSTFTYADGSTSRGTLELVTLSDGKQIILVNTDAASDINAATDQILSIKLGTFNPTFDNFYNQNQYSNEITNSVVCFCENTMVQTPAGERRIDTLSAGDEVITAQNGTQKIIWVGKRKLTTAELVASPHLRPVYIRAGALGANVPAQDLIVSPQHRILIASKIAKRMFGQKEIFVPSIKLVEADGIDQVISFAPVTYVHILFKTHQVIFANGALAESLHTGPCALKALPEEARDEIFEIFPELQAASQTVPTAHNTVRNQVQVSRLLARHKQNRKHLVLFDN